MRGAKRKLSAANFVGALIAAGLAGGVSQSWTIFGVALVALLLASIWSGDILR